MVWVKTSCSLLSSFISFMLPSAGWVTNQKNSESLTSIIHLHIHVWSQFDIFQVLYLSYSCVPAEPQQERSWALMRSSHLQRVPADSSPAPSSCLPTRPLSATWDQHTTEINAMEYRSKNNVLQFKGAVFFCTWYVSSTWQDNIIEISVFVSHSCLCVSSRVYTL